MKIVSAAPRTTIFSLLFIAFFLSACSKSADELDIVNAQHPLLEHLLPSKGQDFSKREIIWDREIESLAPDFYKSVIWRADNAPDQWQEYRAEQLAALFDFYDSLSAADIASAYSLFQKEYVAAHSDMKYKFPDYKANLKVMLVPGVSWGGSYIDRRSSGGKEYLALGLDWYLGQASPPSQSMVRSLIIHESFHDYHGQLRGGSVNERDYRDKGKLFWQLWDEGMASWGMGSVMGDQSPKTVMLMGYENYDGCRDPELATLFLQEIDNKAIDVENPASVKKWFGVYQVKDLGEDTPPMIGYYLGWRTIRLIEQGGISSDTFLSWDYATAKPYIIKSLEAIATEPQCAKE